MIKNDKNNNTESDENLKRALLKILKDLDTELPNNLKSYTTKNIEKENTELDDTEEYLIQGEAEKPETKSRQNFILNFMKNLLLKKWVLMLAFWLTALGAWAQIATTPPGDGSVGNPYQISTPEHLQWIVSNSGTWNDNFIQTADISAVTHVNSLRIGSEVSAFKGTYDGQNYRISDLSYTGDNWTALFVFTDGATIKNLHLHVEIDPVSSSAAFIAGLVARADNSTITNCYTSGNISGTREMGGLIGSLNGGSVTNCYSKCDVQGNGAGGYDETGGLIGSVGSNATVSECFSESDSHIDDQNYGNIVGHLQSGTITNCYSRGCLPYDPSDPNFDWYGGTIGYMEGGTVTNCYNADKYQNWKNSSRGNGFKEQYNSGTVSNCFYDIDQAGNMCFDDKATSKTTTEMKTQTTFTGASWDFTTIWKIDPAVNDGYPTLQWIPAKLAYQSINLTKVFAFICY